MLEKLIEYLKNLPEEEQTKLLEALEEKSEQEEQVEESTEQEQDQTESETTQQTEQDGQAQEERTDGATEEQEQVQEQGESATEPAEEQGEQTVQEQTEQDTEENATENPPAFQELLETKIELALVKAGIREDRLEAAKRLFKTEIHSLEELDKLKELVKEFPEWQKQKEQGKGFGVPIKDSGTSLTEEEKKLKSMGIDPKN